MLNIIRRTTAYLLALVTVFSLIPLQYAWAEETELLPQETVLLTEPTEETAAMEEVIAETIPPETEVPEETTQLPEPEETVETLPQELPQTPEETEPADPEIPETQPEIPETTPADVPENTVAEDMTEPEEAPEPTVPEETQIPETEPEEADSAAPEKDPLEEFFYMEEIPDDFVAPFSQVGTGASFYSQRIPASYDSRTAGVVTPVRDQGAWQLCWAFSALAVGESYLLSSDQGLADLSERHLGYYFHGRAADPLGYADGDGTYLTDDYLLSGNNNKFTTFALANWVGAAAEEKYPYNEDPSRQDNASAMDDVAHLTNAYWINAQDTDTIKQYIMRNGTVGLSFYYKDSYYNSATAAYYNDAYTATNHAITLVGWDDDYSPDNFVISPGEKGAWLCKNSHGTDFGMDGYFWLSYRDKSITHASATAFVFEFASGNNYSWNYHHDGSYGTATKNVTESGSIANIYTASGSSDGADEEIRAVGFALADADLNYSIQIYRNLTDPSDPTSGRPAFDQPQSGQTGPCGYYSVPLEETVTVRHGETFSVVVTLYSDQLSSIRYFVDRTYQNGTWVQFTSFTGPNRSFVKPASGAWTDLAESDVAARIKAYTVETDNRSVSSLFFETTRLQLAPGENFFQEPCRLPENADPCLYRWYSDQEQVASVSEIGLVTAIDCGEATITATTQDGSVSASYTVTVKPKLHAINLQTYKTAMTTGESFTPVVVLIPSSAAPHYTVILESSDESVISVDGMTLHAVGPGSAVITVWAGAYYREFTVGVTHSLKDAQVAVEPAVYNGSSLKPAVTVRLNGNLLEEKQDYTLSYSKNKLPGTATVTVTGTGSYSGTLRQEFSITMPRTKILAAENKSGGIRVSWEPCSGVTGYYLYRQKNGSAWKRIKTITGKTYWQDEEASSGGAKYGYKVVPYLTSGKNTYKAKSSPAVSVYRLLTPQISSVKPSARGMVLTWKKVTGADGYRILRSTPDLPEELAAEVSGGGTIQWTDTAAVETGVKYTYRIAAQRTDGAQISQSVKSKTYTACRPATPAGFKATNGSKGITLSWEKVSGASGYEIQRSTDGSKWTTVKTLESSGSLSWTDTSCASGSKYFYRIRTRLKLNGIVFRSEVLQIPVIYRLSRPSVTRISAVTDGFKLSWGRITGADGYNIYRSCNGGATELIAVVEGGKTLSYTDRTAPETGVTYAYAVAARKTVAEQLYRSASSSRKSGLHPEMPADVNAANTSKGIKLSWKKVPYATGYEIQRSTDGTKWVSVKTLSGSGSISWTDTSCTSGSRYDYRVRTVVKIGDTKFRSQYSQTPVMYWLSRPTVTKISAVTGGFKLTWNRIAGAGGYDIYRSCDEESPTLIASVEGGKTLSYTDKTAPDTGKIYTYSLKARKTVGGVLYKSVRSSEKSAIHPDIPADFTVAKHTKGIRFSWKKVPHATGYELQRSKDGTKWSTVKTLSGNAWIDTTRAGGARYYYRVRAVVKLNENTFRSKVSEVIRFRA